MPRRTVTAPDGRKWTLGRRWLPRRKRFRRADTSDVPLEAVYANLDEFGVFGLIFVILLGLGLAFLLLLLAFNIVVIALELLIVVLTALVGVIGRVVFRRPWNRVRPQRPGAARVAGRRLLQQPPQDRRAGGRHRAREAAPGPGGGPGMTG